MNILQKLEGLLITTSIESRVREAQRMIQRELLSENCSVNMRPNSFNGRKFSDKALPVAVMSIPSDVNLSEISRKINSAIGEFDLCGSLSKSVDGNGFVYSVYARKVDEDEPAPLTFRDVVKEFKLKVFCWIY